MPQVSFYGPVVDANDPAIKNETKMANQTFTPLSLYGIYPVTNNFTVGIGVTNPYGLGTEWPSDWVGKYITTKADLQAFLLHADRGVQSERPALHRRRTEHRNGEREAAARRERDQH